MTTKSTTKQIESERHEFLQYPLGKFRDPKDDIGKCWYVVNHHYCGLPADDEIHSISKPTGELEACPAEPALESRLQPCPLLGHVPQGSAATFGPGPYVSESGDPNTTKYYAVVCPGCCSTAHSRSREGVINRWNSRAAVATPPVDGTQLFGQQWNNKDLPALFKENEMIANYWFLRGLYLSLFTDSPTTTPSLPSAPDTEAIAQRRLEIALTYIKRAANRELPKLPCGVNEMSEREVAIFNVGAAAVGNLQFIARELDALDTALSSAPTGVLKGK